MQNITGANHEGLDTSIRNDEQHAGGTIHMMFWLSKRRCYPVKRALVYALCLCMTIGGPQAFAQLNRVSKAASDGTNTVSQGTSDFGKSTTQGASDVGQSAAQSGVGQDASDFGQSTAQGASDIGQSAAQGAENLANETASFFGKKKSSEAAPPPSVELQYQSQVEGVEQFNAFALPTDQLPAGYECGGLAGSPNIYTTAKNSGWLYSGFLYSGFLFTLNEYKALHGNSSAYSNPGAPMFPDDTANNPANSNPGLFTLAACDMSYCILEKIFGQMPGIFYAAGSPKCGVVSDIGPQTINNLLRLFNMGIFCVVCVVIGYGVIGKGVLQGGFEGDILQKNLTLMTTTRMAVSIFSIIPIPGIGYSAMQTFIMYIVLLGVGLADATFRVGLDAFVQYGAIFSYTGIKSDTNTTTSGDTMDYTLTNVQALFNPKTQPSGEKYAAIMGRFACATYKHILNKAVDQDNYNGLSSIYGTADAVAINDVMKVDQNGQEVTISFGDFSENNNSDTNSDTPSCGKITYTLADSNSNFNSDPANFMLNKLYSATTNAMFQATQFWLSDEKTQQEDNYLKCLENKTFTGSDLYMYQYDPASGNNGQPVLQATPIAVVCTFDSSAPQNRVNAINGYVSATSKYASANQIAWVAGCSGNCMKQLSQSIISDVADVIKTKYDSTIALDTDQLSTFNFVSSTQAGSPDKWVDTNSQYMDAPYTADLLRLTQAYKIMQWALITDGSVTDNIYTNIMTPVPSSQASQAPKLSSSMDKAALNGLVQSMLAPFFGNYSVDFISSKGHILTWKNLAVSSNSFITSMMMVMQRMIGFYFYAPGTLTTGDQYRDESGKDSPSKYGTCQDTYSNSCKGSRIDSCFEDMNNAGCFMNQGSDGKPVARGLIGTLSFMYNVGSDTEGYAFGDSISYNPLADYIEIGYTILTAATYYLFVNNFQIFELYAELAGVTLGIKSGINVAGAAVLTLAQSPLLPPWCNRECQYLIAEAGSATKMALDIYTQVDYDRIEFYNSIGTTLIMLIVPFGAILTVLLPLYPTIIFIVGIFGWVASVIEALIAGPMVAVGLAHPEGSDFLGKAEMGMGILFQTFLRPVLIVLGVFLSVCVINIAFYVFSVSFATTYNSLAGYTIASGTQGPLASAMSSYNSWEVLTAIMVVLVMLYATVSWQILSYCCVSMIKSSNEVLAWVSSGSDSRFVSTVDILAATKGQVQSDAGAIGRTLDQSGKIGSLVKEGAASAQGAVDRIMSDIQNRDSAKNFFVALREKAYDDWLVDGKSPFLEAYRSLTGSDKGRYHLSEDRAKEANKAAQESVKRLVKAYNDDKGNDELRREVMKRIPDKTSEAYRKLLIKDTSDNIDMKDLGVTRQVGSDIRTEQADPVQYVMPYRDAEYNTDITEIINKSRAEVDGSLPSVEEVLPKAYRNPELPPERPPRSDEGQSDT